MILAVAATGLPAKTLPLPTSSPVSTPQNHLTNTPTPTQTKVLGKTQAEATLNPSDTGTQLYPVVKVVDGDTIVVNINGKNETIRLIGIDTPETVDPRMSVQCFGEEASAKAKELLEGQRVRLEADASQGERDKYNRLLRYVYLPEGTLFNKLMIEEGYAFEYTHKMPYRYQAEFRQAEAAARQNKRGLWAKDTCAGRVETSTTTPRASLPLVWASSCDCSGNVYNCSDFKTHAEAQTCFESCGGTSNDVHRLDRDKDGIACETLPEP